MEDVFNELTRLAALASSQQQQSSSYSSSISNAGQSPPPPESKITQYTILFDYTRAEAIAKTNARALNLFSRHTITPALWDEIRADWEGERTRQRSVGASPRASERYKMPPRSRCSEEEPRC